MTATATRHAPVWLGFFGLLAGLVGLEAWILSSAFFRQDPHLLATAVTIDLILVPPLLGWLFLIRTRRLPIFSLIPLTALGVLAAFLLVPAQHRTALNTLETVLPLVELGILTLVVLRARKAIRHYREVRSSHADAIDALEEAFGVALDAPRAGAAVATELTVLYYGVAAWFRPSPATSADVHSYHRRGSYPAILGVIGVVMLMELFGLHFLLSRWSAVAAWIATGLGIYSFAWIVGDFHAGRLHPIRFDGGTVHLRTGFRWKIVFSFDAIAGIHDLDGKPEEKHVALVFFGKPDFWIELREPVIVRGIFGITRRTRWLGVGADDAAALRRRFSS